MADIFKKFDADGKRVELDATDDADVITKHMTACSHAVLQIDGIKNGTDHYRLNNGHTQAEINGQVERCVGHLKLMQEESWWKADSVSRSGNLAKAKHTAAIKTGEDYIAANS